MINTCAPRVWVSTVQSSQQHQWRTAGSSHLVWVHLIQKAPMPHPWFPWSGWGQLRRISKSWKWPGASSLERPLSFFMGSHFSISAKEQWLGFGVGQRSGCQGHPGPPRTAHRAAPARLEGIQRTPEWVEVALPSRGSSASHP